MLQHYWYLIVFLLEDDYDIFDADDDGKVSLSDLKAATKQLAVDFD
jgi:hypothetical protein